MPRAWHNISSKSICSVSTDKQHRPIPARCYPHKHATVWTDPLRAALTHSPCTGQRRYRLTRYGLDRPATDLYGLSPRTATAGPLGMLLPVPSGCYYLSSRTRCADRKKKERSSPDETIVFLCSFSRENSKENFADLKKTLIFALAFRTKTSDGEIAQLVRASDS